MRRWAFVVVLLALLEGRDAWAFAQQLLLGVGPATLNAQADAPSDATYIVQSPHAGLSAEQALSALSNGLLKHSGGVIAAAVPLTDYDVETTLRLTTDRARTANTFADVTDWTTSVAASTVYRFQCEASYTTAVSTTALQLSVNGPASPTALRYAVVTTTTATARHQASQSAYDTVTNPATGGAATALPVSVVGTLENGTNAGTLAIRFRSEIDTSAVTLLRGGWCRVSVM